MNRSHGSRRVYAVGAILWGTAVLSCCHTSAKQEPKENPVAQEDNWQKIKDCAEQAAKTRSNETSNDLTEVGSINHYSPKYNRCFVRTTVTMRHGKIGRGIDRTSSMMLLDAFEGSIVAIVPFTGPCSLGREDANCAKADAFISDAMTN